MPGRSSHEGWSFGPAEAAAAGSGRSASFKLKPQFQYSGHHALANGPGNKAPAVTVGMWTAGTTDPQPNRNDHERHEHNEHHSRPAQQEVKFAVHSPAFGNRADQSSFEAFE